MAPMDWLQKIGVTLENFLLGGAEFVLGARSHNDWKLSSLTIKARRVRHSLRKGDNGARNVAMQ